MGSAIAGSEPFGTYGVRLARSPERRKYRFIDRKWDIAFWVTAAFVGATADITNCRSPAPYAIQVHKGGVDEFEMTLAGRIRGRRTSTRSSARRTSGHCWPFHYPNSTGSQHRNLQAHPTLFNDLVDGP
jgi:hypothetical protein